MTRPENQKELNNFQEYVLGFCFDFEHKRVVLIRKTKPVWQAGKLNGVGGKVEQGESHREAMAREFQEETGVLTSPLEWAYYARLYSDYFNMHVFFLTDTRVVDAVRTMEDEKVEVHPVDLAFIGSQSISNLPWIISLALDTDQPRIFVEAKYD